MVDKKEESIELTEQELETMMEVIRTEGRNLTFNIGRITKDDAERTSEALMEAEDGVIFDCNGGIADPFEEYLMQSFLFHVLMSYRTDGRKATLLIHALPEQMPIHDPHSMPSLVDFAFSHVALERREAIAKGRLLFGKIWLSSDFDIEYDGDDPKGRDVLVVADIESEGSEYFHNMYSALKKMKAKRVVIYPLKHWSLEDQKALESEAFASMSQDVKDLKSRPLS